MARNLEQRPLPTSGSSKRQHGPSAQKRLVGIMVLLAVMVIVGTIARLVSNSYTQKKVHDHTSPVSVATATYEGIPLTIRSIGNVLSYSVVNVVPQVGGQLKAVYFTQGQYVKKGQPLFLIDPAPYQAAVMQAQGTVLKDKALVMQAAANKQKDLAQVGQLQANLIRDQATTKFAYTEQKRYNYLQNEGAVSHEQSDQQTTNAAVAKANVEADKKAIENALAVVNADDAAIETAKGTLAADAAALDNVRIQLSWTTIKSPIDGRTGALNVYQGNVVTANTNTPLVTIDQVQPIYVNFTVPEQYLDEVRKSLASNTLDVEVLVEGKHKNAVNGQVSFLDASVNTATGTVVLRAAFDNTDLRLFPGQFVDVIISIPASGKTVVVPNEAIQVTQQGNGVFVVNPDQTVRLLNVEIARSTGDKTALSSDNIKPGDIVVTDGQLQLTTGSKVSIVSTPSG